MERINSIPILNSYNPNSNMEQNANQTNQADGGMFAKGRRLKSCNQSRNGRAYTNSIYSSSNDFRLNTALNTCPAQDLFNNKNNDKTSTNEYKNKLSINSINLTLEDDKS